MHLRTPVEKQLIEILLTIPRDHELNDRKLMMILQENTYKEYSEGSSNRKIMEILYSNGYREGDGQYM